MSSLAYFKLFCQGSYIGLRGFSLNGIRAAGIKRAIGFFLQPIENWSRYPEIDTVRKCLGDLTGKKVLDLGSPKMIGFLLAYNQRATFLLTDIWDLAVKEIKALQERTKTKLKGSITLKTADLTNLESIKNQEFDVIYSVSVVEHIESLSAIRKGLEEMDRVTKDGGIIVISVPIRASYDKEFHQNGVYGQISAAGGTFFSHYFDKKMITDLFFSCSHLKAESLFISQWRTDSSLLKIWRKVPQKIRGIFGILNMLMASRVTQVFEVEPDLRLLNFPPEGDLIIKYRKTPSLLAYKSP